MRHKSEQLVSFEPHSLHLTWYIQLFGDQGDSEELYLRDSELVQQSDVGRTDSFEFELPKLGTLARLVIGIPAEAVGQVGHLLLDRVEERVQAIGCPLAPLEAAPSLRALPNSAHIVRMLLLHSTNTALRLWWNLEPQTSRENRWNTARLSNAAGGMDRASGAHSEASADAEACVFASICLHELCLPVTRFAGRSPFAATALGCKHIVTLPHAQRMEAVYQIHVLTGGLYFAGTDASVHIEIFGSKGNSGILWLQQSQYKDKFERGQIDSFVYTFPDLGELTSVQIGHDGKGRSSGWFLDAVEIVREPGSTNEARYVFELYAWLDSHRKPDQWRSTGKSIATIPLSRMQSKRKWILIDDLIKEEKVMLKKAKAEKALLKYQEKQAELARQNAIKKRNYRLEVYTGSVYGSGTDASVWIQLEGSNYRTNRLTLKRSQNRNCFERAQMDEFKFCIPDIGQLLEVEIGHDGKGTGAGWYIEKIVVCVEDPRGAIWGESQRTVVCERWLDVDKGDKKIQAKFKVANENELLENLQSNYSEVLKRKYTIRTKIGGGVALGTSSLVWIEIQGDASDSGQLTLNASAEHTAEQSGAGIEESFVFYLRPVGVIKQIRLGHSNKWEGASGPGCFVEWLTIYDEEGRNAFMEMPVYRFAIQQRIGHHSPGAQTDDLVLQPAPEPAARLMFDPATYVPNPDKDSVSGAPDFYHRTDVLAGDQFRVAEMLEEVATKQFMRPSSASQPRELKPVISVNPLRPESAPLQRRMPLRRQQLQRRGSLSSLAVPKSRRLGEFGESLAQVKANAEDETVSVPTSTRTPLRQPFTDMGSTQAEHSGWHHISRMIFERDLRAIPRFADTGKAPDQRLEDEMTSAPGIRDSVKPPLSRQGERPSSASSALVPKQVSQSQRRPWSAEVRHASTGQRQAVLDPLRRRGAEAVHYQGLATAITGDMEATRSAMANALKPEDLYPDEGSEPEAEVDDAETCTRPSEPPSPRPSLPSEPPSPSTPSSSSLSSSTSSESSDQSDPTLESNLITDKTYVMSGGNPSANPGSGNKARGKRAQLWQAVVHGALDGNASQRSAASGSSLLTPPKRGILKRTGSFNSASGSNQAASRLWAVAAAAVKGKDREHPLTASDSSQSSTPTSTTTGVGAKESGLRARTVIDLLKDAHLFLHDLKQFQPVIRGVALDEAEIPTWDVLGRPQAFARSLKTWLTADLLGAIKRLVDSQKWEVGENGKRQNALYHALSEEAISHNTFASSLLSQPLLDMDQYTGWILDYVDGFQAAPGLFYGECGIGRSTAMAHMHAIVKSSMPTVTVLIEHYVMAVPSSREFKSLLLRLIRTMKLVHSAEISCDLSSHTSLEENLREIWVQLSQKAEKTVILIDGVDQLQCDSAYGRVNSINFDWLPAAYEWPDNLRVILSCALTSSEVMKELETRYPQGSHLHHASKASTALNLRRLTGFNLQDRSDVARMRLYSEIESLPAEIFMNSNSHVPRYICFSAHLVNYLVFYEHALFKQCMDEQLVAHDTVDLALELVGLAEKTFGRVIVALMLCLLLAAQNGLPEFVMIQLLFDTRKHLKHRADKRMTMAEREALSERLLSRAEGHVSQADVAGSGSDEDAEPSESSPAQDEEKEDWGSLLQGDVEIFGGRRLNWANYLRMMFLLGPIVSRLGANSSLKDGVVLMLAPAPDLHELLRSQYSFENDAAMYHKLIADALWGHCLPAWRLNFDWIADDEESSQDLTVRFMSTGRGRCCDHALSFVLYHKLLATAYTDFIQALQGLSYIFLRCRQGLHGLLGLVGDLERASHSDGMDQWKEDCNIILDMRAFVERYAAVLAVQPHLILALIASLPKDYILRRLVHVRLEDIVQHGISPKHALRQFQPMLRRSANVIVIWLNPSKIPSPQYATMRGHTGSVYDVAFHPCNHLLASASDDSSISIWSCCRQDGSPRQGKLKPTIRLQAGNDAVFSVSFSEDGRYLASGHRNGAVLVWRVSVGANTFDTDQWQVEVDADLKGHLRPVWCVRWAPEVGGRQLLVSAGTDKLVKVWDARNGLCLHVFEGHTDYIRTLSISPKGDEVATAGGDCTIRVWNLHEAAAAHKGCKAVLRMLEDGSVLYCAYLPDGKSLVACGRSGRVMMWDMRYHEELWVLESSGVPTWGAVPSPDGSHLVILYDDARAALVSVRSRRHALSYQDCKSSLFAAAYSPNGGQFLAIACGDGSLRLFDGTCNVHSYTAVGVLDDIRSSLRLIFPKQESLLANMTSDDILGLSRQLGVPEDILKEYNSLPGTLILDFSTSYQGHESVWGRRSALRFATTKGCALLVEGTARSIAETQQLIDTAFATEQAPIAEGRSNRRQSLTQQAIELSAPMASAKRGSVVGTTQALASRGSIVGLEGDADGSKPQRRRSALIVAQEFDLKRAALGGATKTGRKGSTFNRQSLANAESLKLVAQAITAPTASKSRAQKHAAATKGNLLRRKNAKKDSQRRADELEDIEIVEQLSEAEVKQKWLEEFQECPPAFCAISVDGTCAIVPGGQTRFEGMLIAPNEISRVMFRLDVKEPIEHMVITPAHDACAYSSYDKVVRLRLPHGEILNQMAGHLGRILALDISASGSVISAGLDRSVRLWDRESGNAQRILLGATSDITAVRITADEEMVACTCLDGTIRVWDLGVDDADDDPDTLVGHDGAVTACAFCEGDSGETRFLTGDANGIVVVWGISHRQLDEPGNSTASRHVRSFERQHKVHAPIFEGPSPRILAVGWSKASRLLVGMTDRKFFVFWNLDGQVVDHLSFSDMVFNPQESDADWMAAEMRINPNHSVAVACNSVGSAAVFSLFRLGDSVLFA